MLIRTIHIPDIPEYGSVLPYITQCIHVLRVASRILRAWRLYTSGSAKVSVIIRIASEIERPTYPKETLRHCARPGVFR